MADTDKQLDIARLAAATAAAAADTNKNGHMSPLSNHIAHMQAQLKNCRQQYASFQTAVEGYEQEYQKLGYHAKPEANYTGADRAWIDDYRRKVGLARSSAKSLHFFIQKLEDELAVAQPNKTSSNLVFLGFNYHLLHPSDGTVSIHIHPSELPDPSSTEAAVSGTRHWKLPRSFTEEQEAKLVRKITMVLCDEDYDPTKCAIDSPPGPRTSRCFQIKFSDHVDYFRSDNLFFTFNREHLPLAFSCAPTARCTVVFRVNNVMLAGTTEVVLHQIIEHVSPYMEVDNVWRLDPSEGPARNRRLATTRLGTAVLGVGRWKKHPRAYGFYLPIDVSGRIQTVNGKFMLHFPGRTETCTRCRETDGSKVYRHTTVECIWRTCPICRQRGHAEIHCPVARQRAEAARNRFIEQQTVDRAAQRRKLQ